MQNHTSFLVHFNNIVSENGTLYDERFTFSEIIPSPALQLFLKTGHTHIAQF